MHEMSLCEGIRSLIETTAKVHGVRRVSRVRVEIGRFAGVEKQALAFAFDVVMKGSVAQDAALEMIDLPGRALCLDCGGEAELADRLDPCPLCGGAKLVPTGGTEMRVKDLEAA
jgi:hydrogenase nickel incorporation protein HypA/HybF